ncbi:MAG: homocysteine S-methyltransferase family protein [Orrella sp.]
MNPVKNVCLLDGGLGQEIYRRASTANAYLWSVEVMRREPEVVQAVHRAYIDAGSTVCTLNTYAATPQRLAREGLGDSLEAIHLQALEICRAAIASSGKTINIAGSLGPLIGSYRDEPSLTDEVMLNDYRRLCAAQDGVDLFLIETMTNSREAMAACQAASETGLPYSLGIRVEANGQLRSGESLLEVIERAMVYQPSAVLINCSEPEITTQIMPKLASCGLPFGAYANGFVSVEALPNGQTVDALERRQDVTIEAYTDWVLQWIEAGASVVGGCCEITPEHIDYLHRALAQRVKVGLWSEAVS